MIAPHSALPCFLLSHQPPSRAAGGTENNKPRESRENMAASQGKSGRKFMLIQKEYSWLYFE